MANQKGRSWVSSPLSGRLSADCSLQRRRPGAKLKFLGIELDTVRLSLCLPAEKLAELWMLVAGWLGKKFATVKEVESLVGKLQHAARVIRPGWTFMRCMFELLKGVRKGQRFVRLNLAFKLT